MLDETLVRLVGPVDANRTLLLAHGAGAGTDSSFFVDFVPRVLSATGGVRVGLFDFPYMLERRRTGRRRPPNPIPVLEAAYLEAISELDIDPRRLTIGGKSMGGRVATLIANEAGVGGVVCLGYPFHPRGQPEKLRTKHLESLGVPTLICQGDRDPLGNRDEVGRYPLASCIRFHWSPDGDHDLAPRKRSGYTREENWDAAAADIAAFLDSL